MYKLGTVCMIGEMKKGKFEQFKEMKFQTIRQTHTDKLLGLEENCEKQRKKLAKEKRYEVLGLIKPKALNNLNSLYNQLVYISQLPEQLRMFRISSGLLPMADHPAYRIAYRHKKFRQEIERWLKKCKKVISENKIRVSCHPDKFTVINSDNPNSRQKAFDTLRYHKYFMSRLSSIEDGAVINIHVHGALNCVPEFDQGKYKDLIPWLTLENDDVKKEAGFLPTLKMCEKYGIRYLFDIHHYFVETGKWLSPSSTKLKKVLATWKTRPKFHLSESRNIEGKIRERSAHSDMICSDSLIRLTKKYLKYGDIAVEAKLKNIAVQDLFNKLESL